MRDGPTSRWNKILTSKEGRVKYSGGDCKINIDLEKERTLNVKCQKLNFQRGNIRKVVSRGQRGRRGELRRRPKVHCPNWPSPSPKNTITLSYKYNHPLLLKKIHILTNISPSPTNTKEDRTFVTTNQIEISQNMNSDCVQSYAFTTRYLILTSFSNYFHWQDTLHTFLFVFDWSSRDIDLADPDLHLVLLEHSLKNFPFYANARLAKHYCDVWYPYMELWEDWKSTFKKYSI